MQPFYFWKAVSILIIVTSIETDAKQRSFSINYERNTFVKDGKDFRYISGSFHYFRSVSAHWNDILRKFRLAGLNAVQTYVEWSSHQPNPTEDYNFDGHLNLFEFIETAQKNDLLVILRPGPFVDGERDMGGLPAWLLWQKPNMRLRTSDLEYVYFVSRWFDYLLPKLKPYLYENGGNIIMLQVENEYGSYGCDKNYTSFLRDLIKLHLGDQVVLFTTDGAGDSYVKCGSVPEVYPTVDFGPENVAGVNKSFDIQRKFAPQGPLVNSEFYPGWLDHWQKPHSTQSAQEVAEGVDAILSTGANLNIYMFYGGTSFGFKSGSNVDSGTFDPCPTSYDYDAPLTEARDPTEKYFAIKDVISKYIPVPSEDPRIHAKGNYGKVKLQAFSVLHDTKFLNSVSSNDVESRYPLSFEDLKTSSGFVLYETTIDFMTSDPVLLTADQLKDRAFVYTDRTFVGTLARTEQIFSMPIYVQKGSTLTILVENQGRPCYGSSIGESKGLGNVTLGKTILQHWKMYRLGELNSELLTRFAQRRLENPNRNNSKLRSSATGTGSFYYGNFTLEKVNASSVIHDTFVRLDGWTKGQIWVNGFNLGRYWPAVGPQITLYLPGPLLKTAPETNTVVVFELESAPEDCRPSELDKFVEDNNCFIELTDRHVINGETPYKKSPFAVHQESMNAVK